ncbi:hypothetical protein GQ607_007804 [Colletotrichum asianum]|uniref:Secreted protein n=1 Tax=Colletotrichum asianum TaxID=702518 RepID=A0A8H3ZSR4_9PEZI|nr:hypothetical protein GQ607_007804 [Colletotrichum asianum]
MGFSCWSWWLTWCPLARSLVCLFSSADKTRLALASGMESAERGLRGAKMREASQAPRGAELGGTRRREMRRNNGQSPIFCPGQNAAVSSQGGITT